MLGYLVLMEDRIVAPFGDYGPRTERFALGGVFYYMTHGYEPYDNEWFGHDHGPNIIELLQEMKFLETGNDKIDLTRDTVPETTTRMEKEEYEARRQECKQLMDDWILDLIPSTKQSTILRIYLLPP
ncbi:MAG: hypothetical protein Q9217_001024 [Psora testacea]